MVGVASSGSMYSTPPSSSRKYFSIFQILTDVFSVAAHSRRSGGTSSIGIAIVGAWQTLRSLARQAAGFGRGSQDAITPSAVWRLGARCAPMSRAKLALPQRGTTLLPQDR